MQPHVIPAAQSAPELRDESGFTLVELVVAMAMGIVVMFALSSIMIAMLHQSQRTFTRVDATRQARVALNNVDNELHSACVDGSPPVQATSTGTTLKFLSYSGNSASPTPVWHEVTFSGGTLTDYRYAATQNPSYVSTGTGPEWQRGTALTPTASVTLLSNVSQQTSGGSPVPVFQYFRYTLAGTDSSGDTYYTVPDGSSVNPLTGAAITINPLLVTGSGLSQDDAANTVEVLINLVAGATSENINKTGIEADSVTDASSLRLTTPPNYLPSGKTMSGYGPCE
jgi:type II secretory pathway pseudopilin PulG